MSSKSSRLSKPLHKFQKVNACKTEYGEPIDIASATELPQKIDQQARPLKCWQNVEAKVKAEGGKVVNGVMVIDDYKGYYRLVAHAIWEDPDGRRWELTPGNEGEKFVEYARAGAGAPIAFMVKESSNPAVAFDNYARMQQAMKRVKYEIESGRVA